jgi:hypothetical protein
MTNKGKNFTGDMSIMLGAPLKNGKWAAQNGNCRYEDGRLVAMQGFGAEIETPPGANGLTVVYHGFSDIKHAQGKKEAQAKVRGKPIRFYVADGRLMKKEDLPDCEVILWT